MLALLVLLFLWTPIRRFGDGYASSADLAQDYSLLNVVPEHVPGNRLLSDPVVQMQPWLMFNRDELRAGRLPVWNPYTGGGVPHLANFQSAVFSPFSLPFYVLDFRLALLVALFAKIFLLGWFTYCFLWRLGCRQIPSLLGATAFMFSGHNVLLAAYPHAAATVALPAGLFFAERFLQQFEQSARSDPRLWLRAGAGSLAGLTIALTAGLLAGQPEPFFFAVHFVALWVAFRLIAWLFAGRVDWRRAMLALRSGTALLIAGALPAGLAAIQLLPFLEYLRESTIFGIRSKAQSPLGLENWPLAVFPDLLGNPSVPDNPSYTWPNPNYEAVNTAYLGAVALLLAAVGLLWGRPRRSALFFGGAALVWFLFSYDLFPLQPLLEWSTLLSIAPINRSQPIALFCLSACAALGLSALIERSSLRAPTWWQAPWVRSAALLAAAGAGLACAYLGAQGLLDHLTDPSQPLPKYLTSHLPGHIAWIFGTSALGGIAAAALPLVSGARAILWRGALGCAALAAVFLQGGWMMRNYNPVTPDPLFFARTPAIEKLREKVGRQPLVVLAEDTLPPGMNMPYGITLLTNYDTMWIKRYDRLFRTLFMGATGNWRNTLGAHELSLRLFGVESVLTLGQWIPVDTGMWELLHPHTRPKVHPLRPESPLKQVFTPDRDGLRAIALWLCADPKRGECALLVRLTRAKTGEVLLERRLRSGPFLERQFQHLRTQFPTEVALPAPGGLAVLRFSAELDSADTPYLLTLQGEDEEPGWAAFERPDLRQAGARLYAGNAKQPGILLFDWSATVDAFTPVCTIGPFILWRYSNGAGRYWTVHESIPADDEFDAFKKVQKDFNPLRSVVLGRKNAAWWPASDANFGGAGGPAEKPEVPEILEELPALLRLRVSMSRPGWLVLARSWYPGWEAEVDGAPAPLMRANYAFQAVPLDAGEHEVELRYAPKVLRLGAWISAASVVLGLASYLWARRRAVPPPHFA